MDGLIMVVDTAQDRGRDVELLGPRSGRAGPGAPIGLLDKCPGFRGEVLEAHEQLSRARTRRRLE